MAHYAQLDNNNIVIRVFPGKNEAEDGIDWEKHYTEITGYTCKRTSYNTFQGQHLEEGVPFRINYAWIGCVYSQELDGFIEQQPFPSWILNPITGYYDPPKQKPEDTETLS